MINVVHEARDRYTKLVNSVARDIDVQKERVAEARQVKTDEEIAAETISSRDTTTESTLGFCLNFMSFSANLDTNCQAINFKFNGVIIEYLQVFHF